jgi:glyoxylase-like metal-dependent hydrolase (beta-lactamase superfamily II)
MIHFRQLVDPATSTYTYLLADPVTRDAVIIDPVREQLDRDFAELQRLNLRLQSILETHVHADHVTGAAALQDRTGAETVVSRHGGAPCADRQVDDGDRIIFGNEVIRVVATPGHTPSCVTYHWRDRVFTGDALFIGGCGRTDFQGGDAATLYRSVTQKLFTLPEETLIFPGHDYNGRWVSSIGQERAINPRLGGAKSEADFVALMEALDLPEPKRIHEAVPATQRCGRPEAA